MFTEEDFESMIQLAEDISDEAILNEIETEEESNLEVNMESEVSEGEVPHSKKTQE